MRRRQHHRRIGGRRRRKESPTSVTDRAATCSAVARRSRRTLARQKSTSRTGPRPSLPSSGAAARPSAAFAAACPSDGTQRTCAPPDRWVSLGCRGSQPTPRKSRGTQTLALWPSAFKCDASHNRLDIATRSDCQKKCAHPNSPAIVTEAWAANHWNKKDFDVTRFGLFTAH